MAIPPALSHRKAVRPIRQPPKSERDITIHGLRTLYNRGLRFSCQKGCAACCKIPGKVVVNDNDIAVIADYLGISQNHLRAKYVRLRNGQMVLTEQPNGACIFLGDDDRCRIYAVRPGQCRTYPFWPEILANDFTWLLEKHTCPGIDAGRLYNRERIEAILAQSEEAAGFEND